MKVPEQKKENMKKIKDAYMKAEDEGTIVRKTLHIEVESLNDSNVDVFVDKLKDSFGIGHHFKVVCDETNNSKDDIETVN